MKTVSATKFGWKPAFATIKQRLLEKSDVSDIELPVDLENIVARFHTKSSSNTPGPNLNPWLAIIGSIKGLLFKAATISLLSALASAAAILVGMQILQIKTGAVATSTISLWVVLFFAMNLLAVLANFWGNRLRGWVGLAVEAEIARRLANKFWTIRSQALNQIGEASLKVLLTSDARNVGGFMDNLVRNLLPVLGAAIVALPLLAHFAGWAGVAGFFVMLMIVPIASVLGRYSARYQRKIQGTLDELTAQTGEWVRNVRLIRYLGWEEAITRDLTAIVRRLTKWSMRQSILAFLVFGLSLSWWMIAIVAVALFAHAYGIPIDLPRFFAALWLISMLQAYLMHIPTTIRLYANAAVSMQRLQNFFAQADQEATFISGAPINLTGIKPLRVHFDHVYFNYGDHNDVLKAISCCIDLNRKSAIIGEIGSGKTCLLNLLLAEEKPGRGRIFVEFDDGRHLDLWHEEVYHSLRNTFAFVPQHPFISNDTLLANITLNSVNDESTALQAAYAAELEADLGHFHNGIYQEIGEAGINLSGGQRQRVNLARAFHSQRPFLVLDDPMSAVDPHTETRLMDELLQHPGFLLVSHRLNELLRVDHIFVMKDGQIIEQGEPRHLHANPQSHFNRIRNAHIAAACAKTGVHNDQDF